MFPPTRTFLPQASRIEPSNAVVVVFPLVPVTATTGVSKNLKASSTSPMILTPFFRASASGSMKSGTPGLRTIRSADRKAAVSCLPRSVTTPRARSSPSSVILPARSDISVSVTREPRPARNRAALIPVLAPPTTTTFAPESPMPTLSPVRIIPATSPRSLKSSYCTGRSPA